MHTLALKAAISVSGSLLNAHNSLLSECKLQKLGTPEWFPLHLARISPLKKHFHNTELRTALVKILAHS